MFYASSNVTIDKVKPISERKSQDDIISSLNVDITKDKVLLNNGDSILVREVGDSSTKVEIFGQAAEITTNVSYRVASSLNGISHDE